MIGDPSLGGVRVLGGVAAVLMLGRDRPQGRFSGVRGRGPRSGQGPGGAELDGSGSEMGERRGCPKLRGWAGLSPG